MAEPKTISNHFSVTTVEDGEDAVLYEVECNMENIVIASDTTSKSVTPTFRFYRKVGAGTRTAYAAYWRVFFRAGTTYTSQASSGGTTSATPSLTVTTSIDAVVCFLYSAGSSSTTDYLAKCEIAVVKNGDTGIQGIQGKMSRVPYYAGMWGDVSGQSFVVTDYMTPYVNIGSEESPNCKIFVGDNGTYTFPTALTIYNNSSDWAAMDTEFKYLITEAIISMFGQFGSSIFNGDYQYSQHGTLGGNAVEGTYYNLFSPSFIRSNVCQITSDSVNITQGSSLSNRTILGSVFVNVPVTIGSVTFPTYTVTCKYTKDTGAGLYVCAYSDSHRLAYGYVATSATEGVVTFNFTASATYHGWITIEAYLTSTTKTGTIADCKVTTNANFVPNYAVDLLKGALYCNNGWFKNVTVEGVLNNLIQSFGTGDDRLIAADMVMGDDMVALEVSDENNLALDDDNNTTVARGDIYCLDVLRCGNVVKITSSNRPYIVLPFFIQTSSSGYAYYRTPTRYNGYMHRMTGDDLRTLIGKRITFFSSSSNNLYILLPTVSATGDYSVNSLASLTVNNNIPLGVDMSQMIRYDLTNNKSVTVEFASGRVINSNVSYSALYWKVCDVVNDTQLDTEWG